jgi:predicted enzyme related to lactoylglutathione lyase
LSELVTSFLALQANVRSAALALRTTTKRMHSRERELTPRGACENLNHMTDTTPLVTGVDFVCIPAQDFDAMTAFYGETLGLPFVKRYGSRPGAEYQAGNLTLAIMRAEDFGGTFSRNAMPIALQVSDVAAARKRLEAKGVRFVSDTFDSGVCWQAICLDPDGNPLSLHHRYAPNDEHSAAV